jgi:hypothetical protein
VCSSPTRNYATLVTEERIHTLDAGILKGWSLDGLQWNMEQDVGDTPSRLSSTNYNGVVIVGTISTNKEDETLMIHNSLSGEIMSESISARRLLGEAKVKSNSRAHILELVSANNKLGVVTGYSSQREISLSSMAYTELEDYKSVNSVSLKLVGDGVSNASFLTSSLTVFTLGDKVYIMGIDGSSKKLIVANFDFRGKGSGKIVSVDNVERLTLLSVEDSTKSGRIVRVAGVNKRGYRVESASLVREEDGVVVFETISSHDAEALAYCTHMNAAVSASTLEDGTVVVSSFEASMDHRTWSVSSIEGDNVLIPPSREGTTVGLVENVHLMKCQADFMTVAFTTRGGLTIAVRFDKNGPVVTANQLWSTEEALASISSAIFLDETHAISMNSGGSINADDEEEKALQNLQFTHRIQSQLSSLQNFFFGGGIVSSLALVSEEKKAERNFHFGFAKISVLLSEKMHRIVALDTAKKGKVVWSMNLNPESVMHKIVHGGQSLSLNDPHGYGGVHDHELLVMSYVPAAESFIEWKCFDGMTGKVFSTDVVKVSSGVAQIVPLRSSVHHSSHDNCRQIALVVHEDDTVSLIPDTGRSYSTVDEASSALGKAGLFVHTVGRESGEFRAMRVSRKPDSSFEPGSKPFELVTVGTALFDPSQERIVNVAYPQRGEVIQSPSTVLGDDALLLKYLNPHLVVVVTEATKSFLTEVSTESESDESHANSFYKALTSGDLSSGQKRKPLGATKPGEAPPAASNTIIPSLFVTLIDSVSGQILHRVSHAHATEADVIDGSPSHVPVVISENWVVYAFFNQRTRRTDVGVLTLHEGMIDKNGLTAFNGPEQELIFSSLESAKPVVLSKTFGLTKAISALGVTITRAGISSKQFLFATLNDQVISMDRRLMDPRRPNGELKTSEKMEGLVK